MVESPLVFLGQDEEQARITALDYYIRHYSLHPDTPWATLRRQVDQAYRRAGNGEEVYIGELPATIEQKIFPSPAHRASHPGSVCVIVPRQGLAIITARSAN